MDDATKAENLTKENNDTLLCCKDDEINRLKEVIKRRNDTIRAKNSTIQQHDSTISQQARTITGQDASFVDQEALNVRKINSLHDKIQKLTLSLEEKEQALDQSKRKIERVTAENLDKLKTCETANRELEKELNDQKQQNSVLELDVKTRQASLDTANERNERYETKWKMNKEKFDSMKKEHTAMVGEILTLRTNDETEKGRTDAAIRVAKIPLELEIVRIQALLETNDREINTLNVAINEKNRRLDTVEKDLSEMFHSRQLDQHFIATINESKKSVGPSNQNDSESKGPDL